MQSAMVWSNGIMGSQPDTDLNLSTLAQSRVTSLGRMRLGAATDLAAHLTPAGNAVLVRATVELLIATEQWDEAEVWIRPALRIGRERNMQNQVRRAQSLDAALEHGRRR